MDTTTCPVSHGTHRRLSSRRRWRNALVVTVVSFFAALTSQSANAVLMPTTIWGNNFGSSVQEFSLADGSLIHSFNPASTFNTSWNGRGVVQVGNTLYLTNAYNNHVYTMNATTGASIGSGIAFSVAGASGLSAIAYDGTNFWVADYSGTNEAHLYSPTGTLLKTINLTNCTGYCDGVEYFDNKLISNRVDGCCGGTPVAYDVYDLNGNILINDLISNPMLSTGIAFDGSSFWTSNIYDASLSEWSSSGALIRTLPLTGVTNGIEDLSVNYAQVLPPSGIPEPATLALMLPGLAGLWAMRKRRV
ncbi:MAG: PEP-CTERM sorting domain-containing protein [Gammaproteobacteria bacterium]